MEILYLETKQSRKQTENTINEAMQQEHEKLEDDNNNEEATKEITESGELRLKARVIKGL